MRKRDGRPFTGVSIIFEIVPHSEPSTYKRASFLKSNNINDINGISLLGTSDCCHIVSWNSNSMLVSDACFVNLSNASSGQNLKDVIFR
jgi:hypothetical protein